MNDIQTIDIVEKSKFALEKLFDNRIILQSEESFDKINLINGKLTIDDNTFFYIVLKKHHLSRIASIVNTISASKPLHHPLLFVLDYASKEIISFLKKNKLFFVDTVGNCYINTSELKVVVEGRKAAYKDLTIKRAFQKTGLKFLFKVFQQPDLLNGTYREIAKRTQVSLASVSYIIDELKTDGFIVELLSSDQRQLCNLERLIKKWAINYGENLRPKINRGYLKALDKDILKSQFLDSQNLQQDIFLGSEYGAYHVNDAIKPANLVIYSNIRLSSLAKLYKLIPTNLKNKQEGYVELLEAFWLSSDSESGHSANSLNSFSAPLILIYADLWLSTNFRNVKTAEQLLQNEIRNSFLRYNFQW
ncbi:MAG: type IV toxin-antitoxin system AbiEi family antitoxin [Bacteroidota bacterium]